MLCEFKTAKEVQYILVLALYRGELTMMLLVASECSLDCKASGDGS